MSGLTLNLLGPFEAKFEEDDIPFPTAKTQALLAYLLVEEIQRPGGAHQRGTLMTLLWPDTLPESAQANLRQALYRLRKSLPKVNDPAGGPEPFLLSDRVSVWVNPHAVYNLDAARFEEALDEARLTRGEERMALLSQAASLYRGDFLPDIVIPDSELFETWAQQVRESARRRVLQALEELTDYGLRSGDFERAQETARQQIALDSMQEGAYRQLMVALALAGRRNEALAEFTKLSQLLAAELDVEPADETIAIAEAIRRGEYEQPTSLETVSDPEIASPVSETAGRQAELILLKKVRRFWIEGVLDQSLHRAAHIELGKETAPTALAYPWEMVLQQPDQPERPLPSGLSMTQIFDDSGQALLILGEPGAGKTTMLLELAKGKIEEALVRPEAPMPVVFNLTSWTGERPSIVDWLVEELNLKYLIPKRIGRGWVEGGRLLLLLDGLDEVRVDRQAQCVGAINAFRHDFGLVPLAVCSRVQDYLSLPDRLNLSEAIQLLPLNESQVRRFLQESGGNLEAVASMLERDRELAALAQTPLMLNIIALAYGEATAADLTSLESAQNRRQHLLSAYVERMFRRRGKGDYTPDQTVDYLAWLARSLSRHDQRVFLLEQLQPDWLESKGNRLLYALSTRTVISLFLALGFLIGGAPLALGESGWPAVGAALLTSLIMGVILGLLVELSFRRQLERGPETRPRVGPWNVLARLVVVGLLAYSVSIIIFQLFGFTFEQASGVGYGNIIVFGLLFGFRGRDRSVNSDIRPVETIRWSWDGALRGTIPGLLVGVILGLLDQYVTGNTRQSDVVLIFAALGALLAGLVGGLRSGVVASKARPNEGLRLSLRYGIRVGLVFSLASVLVFGLIFGLATNATFERWTAFQFALRLGSVLGLMALLWYGGIEVLHHAGLRLLFRREDSIPARYAQFLDQAVDLIFLCRVGGGYMFVHQLLQDYFSLRR